MTFSTYPLQSVVQTLYQGILLSRYKDELERSSPLGSPHKIVNLSDLEKLYIDSKNLKEVQVKLPKTHDLLKTGDVVIALRGANLKASVVTKEVEESLALAGQNLAVLRPKEIIKPLYLAIVMRSQWIEKRLARLYIQSTGTQLIRLSQLRDLEIPVPDLETQEKIAQFFLATEKATDKAQEAIKIRQKLAQSTLIKLFEQ